MEIRIADILKILPHRYFPAARYSLWLDGSVTVRFTEEDRRLAVMVEGRLAPERLRALQEHVVGQLSALHCTPWALADS